MMILPFSARLRGTLLTLTLTLLSGCALIQDEPAQVAIVNPQPVSYTHLSSACTSPSPRHLWVTMRAAIFRRSCGITVSPPG